MIERHHDYAIRLPAIPPGGLADLSIQLDSDAPFALRLVRSRNLAVIATAPNTTITGGGWRFQNYKRQFQSSDFRTDYVFSQFATSPNTPPFPSRGAVHYPQMIYPASSELVFSVSNPTSSPIVNAMMLFRGSKLYRDGAIASYTYPPRLSPFPFIYPIVLQQVPLIGSVLGAQITIKTDADFVFRYGGANPFNFASYPQTPPAGTFQEVYVRLKDQDEKPYSNIPIHINDLFGQGIPTTYPAVGFPTTHSINDDAILEFPGLLTPEIYLPSQTSLYLDLFRNDTTAGMDPVDIHLAFHGSKIFHR